MPNTQPTSQFTSQLTKKQQEILNFIFRFQGEHHYAPSYREIAEHFSLASVATIHEHVQALAKKGVVRLKNGVARGIEVTRQVFQTQPAVELPLLGIIAAGEPIEAVEQTETLAVPAAFVRDVNSYVLQVRGTSMIDDGILDGDFVVVERNYYPRNGDVVVALLDNAYATLKRYFREPDRIRLQPANAKMKPIYVKNPTIQGVVKAVIRKFDRSPAFV